VVLSASRNGDALYYLADDAGQINQALERDATWELEGETEEARSKLVIKWGTNSCAIDTTLM